MIVCADVGNGGIRVAAWRDARSDRNRPEWSFASGCLSGPSSLPAPLPASPCHWLVASVHSRRLAELRSWIQLHRPGDSLRLLGHADIPLKLDLESPQRTGIDRLLAAWSVTRRSGPGPAIVVDAGTAVTVDLVNADGVFCGGNIFPGLQACLDQLAGSTDQLPRLETGDYPSDPLGKSTQDAIRSGVCRAQAGAIRYLVGELTRFAGGGNIVTVLTGGGIPPIRNLLPSEWQYEPHLLLEALFDLAVETA